MLELRCARSSRISEPSLVMKDGAASRLMRSIEFAVRVMSFSHSGDSQSNLASESELSQVECLGNHVRIHLPRAHRYRRNAMCAGPIRIKSTVTNCAYRF